MQLLSTTQAANKKNVHPATILNWLKKGLLQPYAIVNGRAIIEENELDKVSKGKHKKIAPNAKAA